MEGEKGEVWEGKEGLLTLHQVLSLWRYLLELHLKPDYRIHTYFHLFTPLPHTSTCVQVKGWEITRVDEGDGGAVTGGVRMLG